VLISRDADASGLDALEVFAHPLRRRILELLAGEQLCTCHLVDETGAAQPTVSHHLRLLRQAGLVATEAHGRFTYYRLLPEAVRGLSRDVERFAARAAGAQSRRRPCS
jgi:ArsR family transcriptional regulator